MPKTKNWNKYDTLILWFLMCGLGASYLIYFPQHRFDSLIGGVSLLTCIYMVVTMMEKNNAT